jgi:hypothetical protein
MSPEHETVVAWLVAAHLTADFVLQTGGMARGKYADGRRAWHALIAHIAVVALCLSPAIAVFGAQGGVFVLVNVLAHAVLDRLKVRLTRRAEAAALREALREVDRRAALAEPEAGLGRAWTPIPGALFVLDQVAHVAVLLVSWALLLARATPLPLVTEPAAVVIGRLDPAAVDRLSLLLPTVWSLLVVNVRAGALFVAVLLHPRSGAADGRHRAGRRPGDAAGDAAARPEALAGPVTRAVGYTISVGPWRARVDPDPPDPRHPEEPRDADRASRRSEPPEARVGEAIGVLERLLIVVLVMVGGVASVGLVIAAKTLARFKQLDDREFAEYYLLGTLASTSVAVISALIAAAVLA